MKTPCTCPICRRGLRLMIEQTLLTHRRWMGEIGIRIHGRLDWAPLDFIREVLDEMCQLGILIRQLDHPKQQRNPISLYLLARITLPTPARKRGVS